MPPRKPFPRRSELGAAQSPTSCVPKSRPCIFRCSVPPLQSRHRLAAGCPSSCDLTQSDSIPPVSSIQAQQPPRLPLSSPPTGSRCRKYSSLGAQPGRKAPLLRRREAGFK